MVTSANDCFSMPSSARYPATMSAGIKRSSFSKYDASTPGGGGGGDGGISSTSEESSRSEEDRSGSFSEGIDMAVLS